MASLSTKHRYLLPGEREASSPIVHHHGIYKKIVFPPPQNSLVNIFHFISRVYKPNVNDFVLGIVLVRAPDLFLVDINSTEPAILPITLFDHGCLPSRQAMNRLSVVSARVVRTDAWTQTELSCQTPNHSPKKSNLGLLQQGHILRCSAKLCTKLQQSPLIGHFIRIVKDCRFRVTRNGFVWYTTDTINSMIAVQNVIYKHEFENDMNHLIDFYYMLLNELEQQKLDIKANQIDQ